MASNLTVNVHPGVYMSVVDTHMRLLMSEGNEQKKCMGTLMGYYEKGSIQVTNCFAIPFNESNDNLGIVDQFNQQMISALKKTSPNEQPVGWFLTTTIDLETANSSFAYYEKYLEEDLKPVGKELILLGIDGKTIDTMHLYAWKCTNEGKPGAVGPHFNPLRVELAAFPGELVAVQLMEKALDSRRREATLECGLELFETDPAKLGYFRGLKYDEGVKKDGEKPGDAQIGRQLMDIVTASHPKHVKTEKKPEMSFLGLMAKAAEEKDKIFFGGPKEAKESSVATIMRGVDEEDDDDEDLRCWAPGPSSRKK